VGTNKKKPVKKTKPAAKAKKAAPKPKAKKSAAKALRAIAKPAAKKVKARSALNNRLTPLDDRLLVAVEGPSEKTAGGILIPGSVVDRPNRGTVLAKGRGRRNKKGSLRPLDVSEGDTVLFPEFSGTKITIDGQELLILREEDVLGIVT
jgi:chaperonin GroES